MSRNLPRLTYFINWMQYGFASRLHFRRDRRSKYPLPVSSKEQKQANTRRLAQIKQIEEFLK